MGIEYVIEHALANMQVNHVVFGLESVEIELGELTIN